MSRHGISRFRGSVDPSQSASSNTKRQQSSMQPLQTWFMPGPVIDEEEEQQHGDDDNQRAPAGINGRAAAGLQDHPLRVRHVDEDNIEGPQVPVDDGVVRREKDKTGRYVKAMSVAQNSYNVVSAMKAVNKVVMTKSLRLQRVTKLVEPMDPTTTPRKRADKVTVYMHVIFLKVGEIDTVKETYAADVFVQARWREPLFDGQTDLNPQQVDWSKCWNPRLYVDNSAHDPKETIWHTVMFNANMEAYVFERRRIVGSFIENLELDQFPFDTQDITLTLVSERSVRELTLEEDYGEVSTVNVQSFVDEQEWRLYSSVQSRQETLMRVFQGDDSTHPAFSMVCHASRRSGFYFWNILFVMFFICSMSFGTFSVDYIKRENRLQLTFILLLTNITFKFAVSQSLPRISYLTYLDKYILSSLALMCIICVWHAIIPSIDSNIIDKGMLAALGGIYIIAHVIFCIFINVVAIRRRQAFVDSEREHKIRLKHLQKQSTEQELHTVRRKMTKSAGAGAAAAVAKVKAESADPPV